MDNEFILKNVDWVNDYASYYANKFDLDLGYVKSYAYEALILLSYSYSIYNESNQRKFIRDYILPRIKRDLINIENTLSYEKYFENHDLLYSGFEDTILNKVYLDDIMDTYLNKKEKYVIKNRFGLNNNGISYYKDLANEMNLAQCTISSIEQKTINKLKDKLGLKKPSIDIFKKYTLKNIFNELYENNFNDINLDDKEKDILLSLFKEHLNNKQICEKLAISEYSFSFFYNRLLKKIENYIIMKEENNLTLTRKP